jgi:transcriptional/translational regulatory protein YebC/TACO1
MFENKGLIAINRQDCDEDRLMELVLDAGADDMTAEQDVYEVVAAPANFDRVKNMLDKEKIQIVSSEITYVPKTIVNVEGKQAEHIVKLMEALEELDDVQHLYSNFDMDESELEG